MKPGQRVRLILNPARIGVSTGKVYHHTNRTEIQVQFVNNAQWIPLDQLEIVPHEAEHPFELVSSGRFASLEDLARVLAHVKLSGRLADVIYSMETTNTDFYAYQFKPVLKMLNSPGKGILVADEVGLGKTIEAGLIWMEFKSRFDLKRLMVLSPAILAKEKWQHELRYRFGIDAEIADAARTLELLKESFMNPTEAGFSLVGSMQGLRPRRNWNSDDEEEQDESPASQLARFLKDQKFNESLIDLLIIDEAHYLKNPESKTAQLGRLLKDVSEYIVLLTATPIHLKSSDLFQLLNIVDEDTFNHPASFERILEANTPLVKAKELLLARSPDRNAILESLGTAKLHPLLQGSRQLDQVVSAIHSAKTLTEPDARSTLLYQLETANLLGQLVSRTRKRDVLEQRVLRQPMPEMVTMRPVEERFYSRVTNLVRQYCDRLSYSEGFLLVTPQRQLSSSMPAALREWQRRRELWLDALYEDVGMLDEDAPQPGPLLREILRKAEEFGDWRELSRNDSKFDRLLNVIQDLLLESPEEKVIIFSYFIPTLQYLFERLSEKGIRAIVLRGGQEEPKSETIEKFADPRGPNILLSSEVGSEGIDLQFCHFIVNYDLPWNPMRIEQRIGRVDRLGQKSPRITIWNLFYEKTIDERIYTRLYERLRIFEETLGGLDPVLGDGIQKLTYELLSSRLTPEQEELRVEQTAQALVNLRKMEEDLEQDAAFLVAFGDFIINQVNAARELKRQVTGEEIFKYISGYCAMSFPGCRFDPDPRTPGVFSVSLSQEFKFELEDFIKKNQIRYPTALVRSDPAPVRCLFENKVGGTKQINAEGINQVHPIVRFVGERMSKEQIVQNPAVAIVLDRQKSALVAGIPAGTYAFTVHRWTLTGLSDQEKLHYTAYPLHPGRALLDDSSAEKLVTTAIGAGSDWIGVAGEIALLGIVEGPLASCIASAKERYEAYVTLVRNQNLDRADVQERMLDQHLENQLATLESTFQKHLIGGRNSLAKATQGRMEKLRSRVERKRIEIQSRRKVSSLDTIVSAGIIKLL